MNRSKPVLLLGFNRPELMGVVLDRIRAVRPERLFVAVDGPRSGRVDDVARVQACRDLVQTVDWPCEVRTLFQESNLGCGLGVSTAISWFFENVDEGIILEDDIVPDVSFFGFCSELLDRYRDDDRVFAISGCNVVPTSRITQPALPYRFSRIPTVWGWATWRRSWNSYQIDIRGWRKLLPITRLATRFASSPGAAAFWASEFELTSKGNVDTWDWQVTFAAMRNDQWTATPNINLVENIGFGSSATHTTRGDSPLDAVHSMALPTSPVPVKVDQQADNWATTNHFGGGLLMAADRIRQYRKQGSPVVAPWL